MTPCIPSRRLLTRAACAAGLAAFAASPASAVSDASELCTGDPCNITTNATIDDGAVLDFGDRRVNLRARLDIGDGFITISAGSLILDSDGRIQGRGGPDSIGGDLEITTSGNIEFKGDLGDPSAIELTGCDGGVLNLTSTAGDIINSREINLNRLNTTQQDCQRDGVGGEIIINDAQNVTLSGRITALGGSEGGGGTLEVNSDGDFSVDDVDLSGGDGAFLDVTTAGSATLGDIDVSGTGEAGSGGEVIIDSLQDITLNGELAGKGATDQNEGGDGGFVDLFAGSPGRAGHVQVLGSIDLNGRGPFGSGGGLTIDGSRVTISADIELEAQGKDGLGGTADITSNNALLNGDINAEAAEGGGEIAVGASRSLTVNGDLSADASGNGGAAGDIFLEGTNAARLTIGGNVHASAIGNANDGGRVFLSGLIVEVGDASPVESEGDGGSIDIESCRRATLTGDFRAGPTGGIINVVYATPTLPPLTAGSTFNPNPVITEDVDSPFCVPEPGVAAQLLSVIFGLGVIGRIRSRR